ncbi:23S rRNA (pseudouridine(1915)-N(3))-methyltransferase RlmH [Formicincola oecophyllae]|uniref:Ribosomal RNA large subunit methyltransferase H n=1 Tax=Formicincola oecophyllae TaxID=2558361 RepID=A0A4Y6U7R9_9PROT|nr:23S rRNA (pseudouridine(1915)-N(3))-methyltransferase RlmH [Formicincola oecophyllae]QDH13473.1 23S rRNA (pseudouridine(1915)-N(3))-methyltransferase RlmH [Formicincola oecophyllae]
MRLLAVGKMRRGPEQELFERYRTRLSPKLTVTELPQGRGSAGEIKRREGEALLAACPDDALLVALDMGGPVRSSEKLAVDLERWRASGRPLCFAIGGAEGFDQPVLSRADAVLTLGPLTWPHMLVRILLAEQIYRAQAIATGHPYHRSGRPG